MSFVESPELTKMTNASKMRHENYCLSVDFQQNVKLNQEWGWQTTRISVAKLQSASPKPLTEKSCYIRLAQGMEQNFGRLLISMTCLFGITLYMRRCFPRLFQIQEGF